MEPVLVEELLADLGTTGGGFDTLCLFWLGEPLLYPRFPRLYRTIIEANQHFGIFEKIEVHTNATHLDKDLARSILNSANTPQVWHLTVDATRPATYRRIKGRPFLPRVRANIQNLIRLKGLMDHPWPRLVLQFIVSNRNVDEAASFRYHWAREFKRAGLPARSASGQVPAGQDEIIFFRQMDCPTPEEQHRQNQVLRSLVASMGLKTQATVPLEPITPVSPGKKVCSAFWKSPVVGWNGDVTVCTKDAAFNLKAGNLHENRFSEIWWGSHMAALRRQVEKGDYQGLGICKDCFIPGSQNYTGISHLELLRQRQWDLDNSPPPVEGTLDEHGHEDQVT